MNKLIKITIVLACVTFFSCDEEKITVQNFGSLSGTILDGETYLPVSGVLITTNPPSISLLSDENGKFTISKVKEGEVAVSVKKKDFLSNTVSVAIYGDEESKLDFLIFKDENNIGDISVYDPVPGNGALDQSTSLTFKWNVEGKKANVSLTYSIYLFESGSTVQKLVGDGIVAKEVTVSGLKNGTTYYWYVVANYEGNKVAFSPTWSFQTKSSN